MTEMKRLREDENKRANSSLRWQKVFLHPVYIGTREGKGIGDGGLIGNKRKVAVDERREKERKRGHSEIRRVLVQPERAHTADASTGIVGGTLFSGLKEASSQPKVTPRTGSLENGRERARACQTAGFLALALALHRLTHRLRAVFRAVRPRTITPGPGLRAIRRDAIRFSSHLAIEILRMLNARPFSACDTGNPLERDNVMRDVGKNADSRLIFLFFEWFGISFFF